MKYQGHEWMRPFSDIASDIAMSHFKTLRLVWAGAAIFAFSTGSALAQADCSLDTDPDTQIDLKIFDTLDDLPECERG
jgi:hypothetical protein